MHDNHGLDIPMRHNSSASKHGIIFCVDVDFVHTITAETKAEVMAWLSEGLQLAHGTLDADNPWHYVCGTRHDQWSDRTGTRNLNGIQITVHFSQNQSDGYFWPLFHNPARPTLDVADVLHYIGEPPEYVNMLGASAVQLPCLSHEWAQTVSDDSDDFCESGAGFGQHLMYTLHCDSESDIPQLSGETSLHFGWPDYPQMPNQV